MSTTAASAASTTLTFPPRIFASVAPESYLQAHLSDAKSSGARSSRPNGRASSAFRSPAVNAGSLTQCSGSAVIRLGNTAVVCGVRGEILMADDVPNPPNASTKDDANELATLGLLVPN